MKRATWRSAVGLLFLLGPLPLAAQDGSDPDLLPRCEAARDSGTLPSTLASLCRDAAGTLQLLQAEVGLALVGGNPVLGTASPIGTKVGFLPRVHVGGRITFAHASLPDVLDYPEDPGGSVSQRGVLIPAAQLDLSVGVFEGLDLAATLGGFGSVELLGSLATLLLPSGIGFRANATGAGLGLRVGLLRESFTTPGISVSALHKWAGDMRLGDFRDGDASELKLNLRAWSFRAGASKSFEFLGLAVLLGYDRYRSATELQLANPAGSPIPVISDADPAKLSVGNWSAVINVSYIVLYFNVVAELGWQEEAGFTTSRDREVGSGNVFGAIGIRLGL